MYQSASLPDTHAHAARVLASLRTAPADMFEPLATVARQLLDTPIAAVNFIDGDTHWTKVAHGIRIDPMPRTEALCSATVLSPEPLLVNDASCDPRFADLALVREGGLRFYAGIPLHVTDRATGIRNAIGALCIADMTPRFIDPHKVAALRALGTLAESVIESHLTAEQAIEIAALANSHSEALTRQKRIFIHAERMARIGSWRFIVGTQDVEWSHGIHRIHELDDNVPLRLQEALDFYPPHARQLVDDTLAHTIRTGEPFDVETDLITAKGNSRRVRITGEVERTGSRTVAVLGVFRDITERYQLEQQLRRSASTDELTGIANRAAFNIAIERAVERARDTGTSCTLVLVDLDRFKEVNDTFGHPAGDEVLRAVGLRLQAPYLGDAFAARLGGDEFALIVTDPADCDRIDALVARLLVDLAVPVPDGEGKLPCSATIGHAAFVPQIKAPRDLIYRADTALYDAKRRARGSAAAYPVHTPERRRAH